MCIRDRFIAFSREFFLQAFCLQTLIMRLGPLSYFLLLNLLHASMSFFPMCISTVLAILMKVSSKDLSSIVSGNPDISILFFRVDY